jgi:hypothetical protein
VKITISKREKIHFTPKVVDRKATEKAREAAPPEERDEVEDVMTDADFTIHLWPLTLKEEEEVMDVVARAAKRESDGATATPTSLINSLFSRKVCGWDGLWQDDEQQVPFVFDPAWDKKDARMPDEVVQAFDLGTRASVFSHLIEQAGMGDEEAVGK